MVFDIATVLLGVGVGAVIVLYAAPKGYFGHPRRRGSSTAVATVVTTYAPAVEHVEAPAEVAPAAAEPAPAPEPAPEPAPTPAPVLALYETVQPVVSQTPVTFSASQAATFGGPTVTRKPTRTYRRRTAPVRSTSATKAPRSTKTRKR